MAIKYPLEIKLPKSSDTESGFKVVAAVLFPLQKAKAFVSFDFDIETFACWPMSVRSVRCEVEVAYGAVEYVSVNFQDANDTDETFFVVVMLFTKPSLSD